MATTPPPARAEAQNAYERSVASAATGAAVTADFGCEAAAAPVAATTCSTDPCVLSWRHTRLTVTARVDFLDDNPEAAALLASISIPAADLSEAILRQEEGTDPRQLAIEWVAANRSLVDGWLGAAISG